MSDYNDLMSLLDEKDAEIDRLHHRVHECGYCDYVATESAGPSAARREMTRHIATCEKHPLHLAERQLDAARKALGWFADEAGDVVIDRAPESVLTEIESARAKGGAR